MDEDDLPLLSSMEHFWTAFEKPVTLSHCSCCPGCRRSSLRPRLDLLLCLRMFSA